MTDTPNIRQERIEKLLRDEITRGMLEKEIDEEMVRRFYVPVSSNSVVFCEFRSRLMPRYMVPPDAAGCP